MLSIGIVGLPNVGKSTLFKALTHIAVPIANYPFTTIEPHVGVVAVPDERLEKLAIALKPEKVVPAAIEFVDIAGLVKGAAEGEGLGNQFLSHIYSVDAILFLLRAFEDSEVPSFAPASAEASADAKALADKSAGKKATEGKPEEELAILREELYKKDEEISKRNASSKTGVIATTPKLSEKPELVVCNIREGAPFDATQGNQSETRILIDCKLELEMSEMKSEELKELNLESKLPLLIKRAYEILDLITFYTIKGGKELRAWAIPKGTHAQEAGGAVHTDFKEKFIRAEVISWAKLLEAAGWSRAREHGWLRVEGRDYEVQDGDVIEFKI